MFLLLCTHLACSFNAATQVTDTGPADPAGTQPTTSSPTGSQPTTADPLDIDDDVDGFSENEGDCDDDDAGIYPGQTDSCDRLDNDCDGEIDEEAYLEDFGEPADPDGIIELGSPTDEPEQRVDGILHSDEDVDRYGFEMPDGLDMFVLTVELSYIPDGANYRVTVENQAVEGLVQTANGSGTVTVTFQDKVGTDETGEWIITVDSLGGADCTVSYRLDVLYAGKWW